MKQFLPILVLVCSSWFQAGGEPRNAAAQAPSQAAPQTVNSGLPGSSPGSSTPAASAPAVSEDQKNAQKAKAIIDQGIQALGGPAYLSLRDREQQGRIYGFHHGRASGEPALCAEGIRPRFVVFSDGVDYPESRELYEKFDSGVTVLSTALQGAIEVEAYPDGHGRYRTYRGTGWISLPAL